MDTELLTGGYVYSPTNPDATAIAITDGVVSWIGTDDVARALHPSARETDLAGRFVAPAFVDPHVHLTTTGLASSGLDLCGAGSRDEVLRALADHAQALAPDALIWARGWDDAQWSERGPLTTADVDAAVGSRPAYVVRIDEHSAAASTALRSRCPELSAATGFDPDRPLTADAHHAVRAAARGLLDPVARQAAQAAACRQALANGIVAVHENGGPDIGGLDDFRALADLDTPLMIRRYWGEAVTDADAATALLASAGADALGGDLFIDGSLGSHTAWLREPYADRPGRGVAYLDADRVRAHLLACTAAGIQAGFHAIGDAAVTAVTDALVAVADELGRDAVVRRAHRIEHAEMVTAEQAEALAGLGVVASMQPLFDALWGGPDGMYGTRLGGERALGLNNFAQLARAGVGLAFGSDSPVTPLRPWESVQAAAHHHTEASRVSPRAAFAAATRGGWRAAGSRDGEIGTLVPGAPATFAVWEVDRLVVAAGNSRVQRWSTDPRSRVPALPDLEPGAALPACVRTVLDGTTVYEAGA
ncbi:amidohydrolase [Jongsikchunia kroppenstedtii]|uniref:amidohydrolase n=1 Tax=Jongsikchunia kroppenstedtii TaxID=1121721 RepID=UPI0003623B34|nr:amidohydrolase family protein [Jongsikchunia kroppenstedtii]